MATHYERPERGWTPIPNELIRDRELPPIARLVLMHALSNREDWEEPAWRIADALGLTRERVTTALNDLVKAGFARRTSRVVQPRRPPVQGWDFAWPTFPEGDSHSWKIPLRQNPATAEEPAGHSQSRVLPLRQNTVMAKPRSGETPLRQNPAPLQDCSSNKTVVSDKTEEQQDKDTLPSEPPPPDPEEAPGEMLNFNKIKISDEPKSPAKPERKQRTRTNYEYSPDFLNAWALYGRVGGKQKSFQSWTKAITRADQETILTAIPNYLASDKPRRGFTKDFSTWLNDDGWESESAQPRKKGYQGEAGSDAKPREAYEAGPMVWPIKFLVRNGPTAMDREMCFAWYYHIHHEEQADWDVDQMLATGNTPDDVDRLMDAYAHGIEPELYQRFLDLDLFETNDKDDDK